MPRMGLGTQKKPVEAESHIGAFTNIYKPARTIFQFLATCSHLHRARASLTANFHEPRLKIQPLFVNRARSACTKGVNTAFQFKEGPYMGSVMKIGIEHVSLI